MEGLTTATLFITALLLVTIQPTTAVAANSTDDAVTRSTDSLTNVNQTSQHTVLPIVASTSTYPTATPTSPSEPPTSTSRSRTPAPLTLSPTTRPQVTHNSAVRNYDWVVALIVLASLGIISVVGVELYIHIKICGTPLMIQWTSMWLGHALLFAIFLSYLLMYAFVPYPSATTCAIIRFCLGVCYALCFAVLFVKIVLMLCPEDVPTSVGAVLLVFVWLVQVVVDIQWLIRDPPEVTPVANADGCACAPGFSEHVKSLVYVMVLIVLSLCACVVARCCGSDVTDDARYIGLSSGITVGVWIVWILLGFLKNDTEWHDPCLAFGLLVTVTVLLIVVFVPKLRQLNQLRDMDWDLPVDDFKSDPTFQPETYASKGDSVSVTTSGSKRSLGSVESVGGSGEVRSKYGNGTMRKSELEVENGEIDFVFPPNLNPHALHLQYPPSSEPSLNRSGSIRSAPGGYEPHGTRSTTPTKTRPMTRANPKINYNHDLNLNQNQTVNHNRVNHKGNQNHKVNHNHVSFVVNQNPNPILRSKTLRKY